MKTMLIEKLQKEPNDLGPYFCLVVIGLLILVYILQTKKRARSYLAGKANVCLAKKDIEGYEFYKNEHDKYK